MYACKTCKQFASIGPGRCWKCGAQLTEEKTSAADGIMEEGGAGGGSFPGKGVVFGRTSFRVLFVGVQSGVPEIDFAQRLLAGCQAEVWLTSYRECPREVREYGDKVDQLTLHVMENVDVCKLHELHSVSGLKSFDVVAWIGPTADDALHKTPDLVGAFVAEAKQVLNPDGCVVVVQDMRTPNFRGILRIGGAIFVSLIALPGREQTKTSTEQSIKILKGRQEQLIMFDAKPGDRSTAREDKLADALDYILSDKVRQADGSERVDEKLKRMWTHTKEVFHVMMDKTELSYHLLTLWSEAITGLPSGGVCGGPGLAPAAGLACPSPPLSAPGPRPRIPSLIELSARAVVAGGKQADPPPWTSRVWAPLRANLLRAGLSVPGGMIEAAIREMEGRPDRPLGQRDRIPWLLLSGRLHSPTCAYVAQDGTIHVHDLTELIPLVSQLEADQVADEVVELLEVWLRHSIAEELRGVQGTAGYAAAARVSRGETLPAGDIGRFVQAMANATGMVIEVCHAAASPRCAGGGDPPERITAWPVTPCGGGTRRLIVIQIDAPDDVACVVPCFPRGSRGEWYKLISASGGDHPPSCPGQQSPPPKRHKGA